MAKQSGKDDKGRGKAAGGATRKPQAPRIKATHSEPAVPAAQKSRGRTTAAKSPAEIEKRRASARATVRQLGGRTGPKRLPPGPAKAREAQPPSLRGPGPRKRSVPPPSPSHEARERAITIAAAGLEKKAIGVEVLDVTGRVDYADYLVIMTGTSDRHVYALAMGIEEALKRKNVQALSVEGLTIASWVLMDFDDVVVHVFQEDTRRMYDIEGLWMDASRVAVESGPERPQA